MNRRKRPLGGAAQTRTAPVAEEIRVRDRGEADLSAAGHRGRRGRSGPLERAAARLQGSEAEAHVMMGRVAAAEKNT